MLYPKTRRGNLWGGSHVGPAEDKSYGATTDVAAGTFLQALLSHMSSFRRNSNNALGHCVTIEATSAKPLVRPCLNSGFRAWIGQLMRLVSLGSTHALYQAALHPPSVVTLVPALSDFEIIETSGSFISIYHGAGFLSLSEGFTGATRRDSSPKADSNRRTQKPTSFHTSFNLSRIPSIPDWGASS